MTTRNAGTKKNILVVDDARDERELLKTILEESNPNYAVITRPDSLSALKALYTTPCDLVILDVQLPDQNGIETADRIRKNPKTSHVPIIMLTGLHDKPSVLRALKAGVNDYVVKPYSAETLLEKITRLLAGH